ncbi:HAMP domain-containing histidine kinase [Clostridium grantii]|uniref:histidine kinase n=1 Tax=Clostridium grantii DSM 8605 TaxID=1121316 RepID=A0A1M5WWY5_9CLOT|nr:HAMP domain-containing histidine kinase [Clostridium grantii]SHH92107.1 Signal transduction histidine kinase [Clostridium grantii DSM 8605]
MKSLKKKIIFPVIFLTSLGVFCFSVITFNYFERLIISHYQKLSEEKIDKLVIEIDCDFERWKETMNLLSSLDSVSNLDYEKLKEYVSSNAKFFSEFESILLSDLDGNFLTTGGVSGNIADRDYFKETMKGNTTVSHPILSKSSNNPIIVISAPIKDENGEVKGLIGGTVKLSYITDLINEEKYANNGYAYMMDSTGLMIAHPDKKILYTYDYVLNQDPTLVNFVAKMKQGEEGTEYYLYKNEKKFVSYKPLKTVDFSLAISVIYSDMTLSLLKLKEIIIIASIVFILIITLLLYYHINLIIKPINKLKDYIEIATEGDLSVQSDIDTNDEISLLSNSFNTLIRENKGMLEASVERDKEKSIFFSNISHELKTPLNLIFSTTQLMELHNNNNSLNNAKVDKYIKIFKQNSYRLLRLVNNIIDITKIDSGFIDLNFQNRNIVEVVENITLSTVNYIESQSKEIIFDTEIEEKIMAFDPDAMERIILNLISNAIKFTNANDIIQVSIFDKNQSIVISVKDTGIGIPEDKQKIIFERFAQVDSLLTRKKEGSGIGLTLVKSLVEMHGGSIHLISGSNEGSEFIVEIPVNLVASEESSHKYREIDSELYVEKINIEFSDIYY